MPIIARGILSRWRRAQLLPKIYQLIELRQGVPREKSKM